MNESVAQTTSIDLQIFINYDRDQIDDLRASPHLVLLQDERNGSDVVHHGLVDEPVLHLRLDHSRPVSSHLLYRPRDIYFTIQSCRQNHHQLMTNLKMANKAMMMTTTMMVLCEWKMDKTRTLHSDLVPDHVDDDYRSRPADPSTLFVRNVDCLDY